ncbi:hypothetical protein HDU92_006099 [Lobulomyces angularis]|nr:hypothetical protein HDU92_006099 [Lobulomyces angularis]
MGRKNANQEKRSDQEKQLQKSGSEANNENQASTEQEKIIENDKKPSKFAVTFRYVNALRAVATAGYSIYLSVLGFQNSLFIEYQAQGMLYATIVSLSLDVIFTIIRAFPSLQQKLKFKKTTKASRVGAWSVIADQELMMDLLTPLINGILKIYNIRLCEIVNGVTNFDITIVSPEDLNSPLLQNRILLGVFCLTLTITILSNGIRLFGIMKKRKAKILGCLVIFKTLLLVFDIFINGFFLYIALVPKTKDLFSVTDPNTIFALMVVVPSPIVSMVSNSVVNLPLHYYYLKMTKGEADEENKEKVKNTNDFGEEDNFFKKAVYQTFNKYSVGIFGLYGIWSCFAMYFTLTQLDLISAETLIQESISAVEGRPSKIIILLVWINVALNYALGVACTGIFLVYTIVDNMFVRPVRKIHSARTGSAKPKKSAALNEESEEKNNADLSNKVSNVAISNEV